LPTLHFYHGFQLRLRLAFAALALLAIVLGLVVSQLGTALPVMVRDVLGDALWALMITAWIGAALPRTSWRSRALAALLVCWTVELSQAYHAPLIDAWRGTTLGHLVLGTDFDARDLGAYAIGVAAAVAIELAARRRGASSATSTVFR
jgi:uncharacterized protein DUF2809